MRELALNILDIVENSVKAKANLVKIEIEAINNYLSIKIADNGCGMDENFLAKVTDPFTTTRTTRKVGMGIPLFKMAAEMSGGTFSINSKKGVGTTIIATFEINNIDREPLGDVAETIVTLLSSEIDTEYYFKMSVEDKQFEFDTRELKAQLNGIPVDEPEVLQFVKDMIEENIREIGGAKL